MLTFSYFGHVLPNIIVEISIHGPYEYNINNLCKTII